MNKIIMLHSIGEVNSRVSITFEKFCSLALNLGQNIISFDDGYANNFTNGLEVLKNLKGKVIIFLVVSKIGSVHNWDKGDELANKLLLNWEQIVELQRIGVRFGSHSLTHADLTKLGDRELERETRESKRILEERLCEPVEGFAYPYGYFNERVIGAVKDAGYKWAVTTSDSIWEGRGDPYRLRRINISGPDPDWLLWAKLSGFYDIKAVWELPALAWEKLLSSVWAFGKTR